MNFIQSFIALLLAALLLNNACFAESLTETSKIQTKKDNGQYVRERFLTLMKKPFITKQHPQQQNILIIGDSHAQDFLNAIIENNFLLNDQIRTRYIPTRCQIILEENIHRNWLTNDKQLCEKSDNLELARKQIHQADVIIFASLWRKWAAEKLAETIRNLKMRSEQKLYVIGRRSFRKVSKNVSLDLTKQELKQLRNEVDKDQMEINNLMKSKLNETHFINVHEHICGKGSTCPVYTDNYKLISFDGGHLSQAGARYFGRILFEQTQLRSLLE